MFQTTPFHAYYTGYTTHSDSYSFTPTPDPTLQPYLVYFSVPAENYQNCFLRNAQNSYLFPHRSSNKTKEESGHYQNHTLIKEQSGNQRKIYSSKKDVDQKQQANKQKFGRNILSNIFHLMIKFIKRQKKFRKLIEKLIQANGMSIKTNEFYQIFKRKSSKLRAYATLQQIKDFWSGNSYDQTQKNFTKQKECSKLFRILGKLYLEKYHIPYVFNSNKIKKQSKTLHNGAIRKIKSLC